MGSRGAASAAGASSQRSDGLRARPLRRRTDRPRVSTRPEGSREWRRALEWDDLAAARRKLLRTAGPSRLYGGELDRRASAGHSGQPSISRWNGSAWLPLGRGDPQSLPSSRRSPSGETISSRAGTSPWLAVSRSTASRDGTVPRGTRSAPASTRASKPSDTWGSDFVAAGRFPRLSGTPAPTIVVRWAGASWDAAGDRPRFSLAPDLALHALCDHQGRSRRRRVFSRPATTSRSGTAPLGCRSVPASSGPRGQRLTSLALASWGGALYAGGTFTASQVGIPTPSCSVGTAFPWQGVGGGLDGPVSALGVHGGELIAGGPFSLAGGVPVERHRALRRRLLASVGYGTDRLRSGR